MSLQYIPRNMHTVFALLCFVVVIHWLIFPYPSGLLHWHFGNLTIAPVPAKQPWWIEKNTSCEFIMNDCITTTKQCTTKPCAYFLGYTVYTKLASSPPVMFPDADYACRICINKQGQWSRDLYFSASQNVHTALLCFIRLWLYHQHAVWVIWSSYHLLRIYDGYFNNRVIWLTLWHWCKPGNFDWNRQEPNHDKTKQ